MHRKLIIIISIITLMFTNSFKAHANPAIPAAVLGGIGISALAGASAAALEGYRGFENAQTAYDVANVIWDTAEAAKKEALQNVVGTAISTGVNTIELSTELSNWWQEQFKDKSDDIVLGNPTTGIVVNTVGPYVLQQYTDPAYPGISYKLLKDGIHVRSFLGLGAGWTISLSVVGGDIYLDWRLNGESRQIDFVDALDASWSIDNWGEEVGRLLSNVFATGSIPLNLSDADIIATDIATDLPVTWNPDIGTWIDTKGVSLPVDLPVDNVQVKPKTATENPPIEENPPFELDLTVPETAALDFQPLVDVFGDVTRKFPFSIPWDLKRQLSMFNVQPEAPEFKIDFSNWPYAKPGTELVVKLDFMNPLAAAARWALTIAIDIAFILMLRRLLPE